MKTIYQLKIHFYDPLGDQDGMINHLVRKTNGPYCHCEVQFINGLACSIYMGTTVCLKHRGFDESRYTTLTIPCSKQGHTSALDLAHRYYDSGVKFSGFKMASSMLSIPLNVFSVEQHGTFCSELVANLLVSAGVLPRTTMTHCVTPSSLYRLLESKTFVSSPVRIEKSPVFGSEMVQKSNFSGKGQAVSFKI
jgi:hypothetical protein